jgi:hypothetical protein
VNPQSSSRLRSCFCGARLACEADLEHRAKATADRTSASSVESLSSIGSVLDAPWTRLRLRKVVRAKPKGTCRYVGQVGRRRGVSHDTLAEADGALRTSSGRSGASPYQRWVGQNNFE